MLAVVPILSTSTSRPDGSATLPITPVTAALQQPSPAQPTPSSNHTATSPSTSAVPSPSKKPKSSKSGAAAAGINAASAAPPPLTAVGSQDSVLGSWSTLSISKSTTATTRKTKTNGTASPPHDGGSSARSATLPMTPTTATFLAPKSRSKSRRPPNHSNSSPAQPRTLVPEPAPPPPSALANKSLRPPQRLSNSSKDRRPTRKHASTERRQSTPYPLSVTVARRNRVSSGPLSGVIYPSETGGSVGPSPLVRRPSPVPPSSSHSDSSRSSDSYVSLKEGSAPKSTPGGPPSTPLPTPPTRRPLPQMPSSQQVLPAMTPKPSASHLHLLAALRSGAQSPLRLPPPTPGIPRIFHPSPLNPNAPPSPYNPYQTIPRFSPLLSRHPGRHAHIVPLPSLGYQSVQQRPRALPASEIDGQVWTATQTGMEEYASDHPQDLRQRAVEMEARDELERVRVWCFEVFRTFPTHDPEADGKTAGEDGACDGGDEFFLLEKPPKIDWETLVPHRNRKRQGEKEGSEQTPVFVPGTVPDDEERVVLLPPVVAIAAPTPSPESLVPFPTMENGRMASPYPAPPDAHHIVHLDSSSASSEIVVERAAHGEEELTPDPAHLGVPLTTQKSFVSLTTPSPFGLPSPLRLPIMQTPVTPFYTLGGAHGGELVATPPAQEPLPPILEPTVKSPVDGEAAQVRAPSALERVSSYLGSTASMRPPSPETPPRIVHSSNSQHPDEEANNEFHLTSVPSRTRTRSRSASSSSSSGSLPSNPWKRVKSADDGASTVSRAFTRTSRGRSPTRRSWKAASERAVATSRGGLTSAMRVGVGMTVVQRIDGVVERVTVVQPVLVRRGEGSEGSWVHKLGSVGSEDERPRTASRSRSRSSRSRYSVPDEHTAVLVQRPETQLSVLTADLFYKAQAATPIVEEEPPKKSTTPETVKPRTAEVKKEVSHALPPPSTVVNRPSGVSPSVLRRRKSHRARESVVSLPASEDEKHHHPYHHHPQQDVRGRVKPQVKVHVPTFSEVLPPALRTSFPSTTSVPFISPATSKAVQPLLPLVRPAFHSPSKSSPAPSVSAPPSVGQTHSLLFNKLVVLIAQFNSDLSLGRNKVPRWKRDFAEMEEKVRMVYDAFVGAVERSRVEFRPWLRNGGGGGEEEDEGKTVMYVDDLWARIEAEVSSRGNLSTHAVQEEIIRSVTSSWAFLASECLNGVREVLSQLVTSIVDLHFRCAGDGNQLRMIVQSVADAQLHNRAEMTGRKLAEFAALEARTVFTSSHARVRDNAAAILSHFKDLRRQADHSMLEQGALRQSPVSMIKASSKPLEHVLVAATTGPSHSRESHTMSIPSSFTGQTTLFSKVGVPLSTIATSEDQGRHSDVAGSLRKRLAEQQRQRADSLMNANEAIQVALSSLRSVGFHDLSSPEQLLEKLVEPDPIDEVLEVMANVVAYLDLASIRFADYITLHIEDHLVNAIGEKINDAVVANLDLSGVNIEERCLRWMAT